MSRRPVIARPDSCQTCFQCKGYCPTDALFVAPLVAAVPSDSRFRGIKELATTGLLGTAQNWAGDMAASLVPGRPSDPSSPASSGAGTDSRAQHSLVNGEITALLSRTTWAERPAFTEGQNVRDPRQCRSAAN